MRPGAFIRAWAVVVASLFAASTAFGWRLGTEPREQIPASVRSSPGGYRSYHFWHTGYFGGK